MIGALEYRLRAEEAGSLPASHGTMMHAVCFDILHRFSPTLAARVHDGMKEKPMTSSFLSQMDGTKKRPAPDKGRWHLPAGTILAWRVTALTDDVWNAFASLPRGAEIQLGDWHLTLTETIIDAQKTPGTGEVDPQTLLETCASMPTPSELTLDFRSVTAFRTDQYDVPWPLPEYIFGSLAKRWQTFSMPLALDDEAVRTQARLLLPTSWHGRSTRKYFGSKRVVLGFTGQFSFSTERLPEEQRLLFLLLAQYAELSGTGRWTGYGMGQTRCRWK